MTQQLVTETPEKTQQLVESRHTNPAFAQSFQGGLHPVAQLQRTLGNRNVAKLIQAKRLTPEGKINGFPRKLTVGAADDQYQQEAEPIQTKKRKQEIAPPGPELSIQRICTACAADDREEKGSVPISPSVSRTWLFSHEAAHTLQQRSQMTEHSNTRKKLLAYELIQVQQDQPGKIYRKSYLQEQNISDATTVGKASEVEKIILGTLGNPSGKIYPYIKDKMKKLTDKLSGISIDDPAVFGHKYKKINDIKDLAVKEETVFQTIGGFIDPKKDDIYLHLRSNYCHAFHEAIHTISFHETFSKNFGHELMEGMTQYFTDMVFQEQTGDVCKTHSYKKELECAHFFCDKVGFDTTANIFFNNKYNLLGPVFQKLKVKTVGQLKDYVMHGC